MLRKDYVVIDKVIGVTLDNTIFYCEKVQRKKNQGSFIYDVSGMAFTYSEGKGHASQEHYWPALREATGYEGAFDWLGGWELWTPQRRWATVYEPLTLFHLRELAADRKSSWLYFVNSVDEYVRTVMG